MQDRIGPNRVGPFGLLQPVADGLKILLKEDVVPRTSTRFLFRDRADDLGVHDAAGVLPSCRSGRSTKRPTGMRFIIAPNVDIGIVFIFAVTSLAVYGVILGGWASNNKYSVLGALRASAQVVSYEIPLGMSVLGVVLLGGTLNLEQILDAAGGGRRLALERLVPAAGLPDLLHQRAGRVESACRSICRSASRSWSAATTPNTAACGS